MPPEEIAARATGESSEVIRTLVTAACEHQLMRQGNPNAQLISREIDKVAAANAAGEQMLEQAISRLGPSARGYHQVLKVAGTIADLGRAEATSATHMAEAVQYRRVEEA